MVGKIACREGPAVDAHAGARRWLRLWPDLRTSWACNLDRLPEIEALAADAAIPLATPGVDTAVAL